MCVLLCFDVCFEKKKQYGMQRSNEFFLFFLFDVGLLKVYIHICIYVCMYQSHTLDDQP